jgi:hypothetical protein
MPTIRSARPQYEWNHGIGEINASRHLIGRLLVEYDWTVWLRFPAGGHTGTADAAARCRAPLSTLLAQPPPGRDLVRDYAVVMTACA